MKTRLVLALLFVALVAAQLPAQGLSVPKPTAEITSFRLEALTLREVTFAFVLTVNNPYPVALPIDGLSLDFLVEGTRVFQAANQGKFDIPAKKKKATSFTVVLSYEGIASLVKDYLEKDWLDTVVQGKLVIALPKISGLPKTLSFDYKLSQTIPALKPEVSLLGFSVQGPSEAEIVAAAKKAAKKVNAKEAFGVIRSMLAGKKPSKTGFQPQDLDLPFTVTYVLAIQNKANAPLGFQSLGYGLSINEENLVSGESTQVKQEGTKTLVTVANTFRSKQLSEGLQSVFQARKGAFRVTGKAQLQLPPSIRKEPVPLAFDERGTFSF